MVLEKVEETSETFPKLLSPSLNVHTLGTATASTHHITSRRAMAPSHDCLPQEGPTPQLFPISCIAPHDVLQLSPTPKPFTKQSITYSPVNCSCSRGTVYARAHTDRNLYA